MSDPTVWDEWRAHLEGLNPSSPLDQKARDFTVGYFDMNAQSIAGAAKYLDIDRQTATRRLERAHVNGWVLLGAAPFPAKTATLPRVCRRRIFWTTDHWTATPARSGDPGQPAF